MTPVWYRVRDLQAARTFYTEKLRFTETYADDDGTWVKLERNGMEIALAEGEPAEISEKADDGQLIFRIKLTLKQAH